MDEERAKTLVSSLVELLRESRQELYNSEFAKFLMEEAGMTQEELITCGIFNKEDF